MSRSALQRITAPLIADAPATADLTLVQACRLALGEAEVASPWDKGLLDGYPGEPGLSRRQRAIILLAAVIGCWLAIAAIVMAFTGPPAL